jgi:hypothetical protein
MGCSYITLLTAFYVDNGPHLPLWRLLPPIALWTLPTVLGTVPMVRALRRHNTAPPVGRPRSTTPIDVISSHTPAR